MEKIQRYLAIYFQKKFPNFHRELTVYKFVNNSREIFNFSALKISKTFIAMKMANVHFFWKKKWPTIALTGPLGA